MDEQDFKLPEPNRDTTRKIIHIDMDAFFSSVEERDNPALKGKPVIIAKHPRTTGGKGIVSTANYEARKYGIHSAMSAYEAYKRCPEGIFLSGNYKAYQKASLAIREIMFTYTELVEPMSIDEAYLDVTDNHYNEKSASKLARQIQFDIWKKTGLTSSAGVSYNKFLAKIASDVKKPAGLTVIPPDKALTFIKQLAVEKFPGIGPKTAEKMHRLNIYVGDDLYRMTQLDLVHHFGKAGLSYYKRARGIDNNQLKLHRDRKSVGKEHTYAQPLVTDEDVLFKLRRLADEVQASLERVKKQGKTIVLKIRYRSFDTITRRISLPNYVHTSEALFQYVQELWFEYGEIRRHVRLLGLSVTNLVEIRYQTLSLF
ncbi:DNA polymerase IV [Alkalihalobacillus sp. LMS6]|uniref:DNA polymerase IV n=1 Tax=Alkalihalobacillus sp. LMS6 TaxID=2924034 RepID=UPI0020D0837F|nr:DNA polymerase IV [Alkalihalobacillus sp. LMS6]UTR04680.1 DNA polymerase IV [Alkalihalobacillus sp. LMS6]